MRYSAWRTAFEYLPRAVDEANHRAKNLHHYRVVVLAIVLSHVLELIGLFTSGHLLFPPFLVLTALSEDPVKNDGICKTDDEQEERADRGPDYSTELSNAINLVNHVTADGNGDVYDYHDGAMPEREEQAAGDGKLPEANESSGCVVDGTVKKLKRRDELGICVSNYQ